MTDSEDIITPKMFQAYRAAGFDTDPIRLLESRLRILQHEMKRLEGEKESVKWYRSEKRFDNLCRTNLSHRKMLREVCLHINLRSAFGKRLREYLDGPCRCGKPLSESSKQFHASFNLHPTRYGCDDCGFCGGMGHKTGILPCAKGRKYIAKEHVVLEGGKKKVYDLKGKLLSETPLAPR